MSLIVIQLVYITNIRSEVNRANENIIKLCDPYPIDCNDSGAMLVI